MPGLEEILERVRAQKRRPGEEDLRRLPYGKAFIYGRVSSRGQVKESRESIRDLARLLELAIGDGYKTGLDVAQVESWLEAIQSGVAATRVLEDRDVIIDCQDLGLSGSLKEDKRPGLAHLWSRVESDEVGAVYLTEGMSRLSRDEERVLGYRLLSLLKRHGCRVRTMEGVFSPAIPRDWDMLAEDVEDSAQEKKKMGLRLRRRLASKAAEGKHVGNPVTAGFIVPILGQRRDGSFVFRQWDCYPVHQEIVITILKEYVRQRATVKTTLALAKRGVMFPPFPEELRYMESRTALKDCRRTEDGSYIISEGVVKHLATELKLIGIWDWGDNLIVDNHPAIVPLDLFLQAYEIAVAKKPKGRAVYAESQDWAGLLWCYNHDVPRRVYSYNCSGRWVCPPDYALGEEYRCLDVIQRVITTPLTQEFLRCLDLSPYMQAVLDHLKGDTEGSVREEARLKREEARLRARLENLESYLGSSDPELEESYRREIKKVKMQLEALPNSPTPPPVTVSDIDRVRQFLENLERDWQCYPASLRNMLLRMVVDRVELRHQPGLIEATVIWKVGFRQVIEIRWPGGHCSRERRWQREEDDLLRMLWPTCPRDTIEAAFPERSWEALVQRAARLGVKRRRQRGCRPWTQEELQLLRHLCASGVRATEIAHRLGRSKHSVMARAWWMKLDRSQSFLPRKQEPVWEVKNINVLEGEPRRYQRGP